MNSGDAFVLTAQALRMLDRLAPDIDHALLLTRAQQLPLWLRRHGLALTLARLKDGGQDAGEQAVCALLQRVLQNLDTRQPLALEPADVSPLRADAYARTSAAALRHAEAFARVAKLQLAPDSASRSSGTSPMTRSALL